jgi:hypothetical protein
MVKKSKNKKPWLEDDLKVNFLLPHQTFFFLLSFRFFVQQNCFVNKEILFSPGGGLYSWSKFKNKLFFLFFFEIFEKNFFFFLTAEISHFWENKIQKNNVFAKNIP